MPKINKKTDDQIIEKEQKTNSGISVMAGEIIKNEFDKTDFKTLQQNYEDMIKGNPIISTTTKMLKMPMYSAGYRIDTKNEDVKKHCEWVIDNLKGGYARFKEHALFAIEKGLSMFEVIIKRADKNPAGKLTNRPCALMPFQNTTINKFYYDENSRFIGIEHIKEIPEKGTQYYDIVEGKNGIKDIREKLLWFTFQEEYGDIRGNSILRPMRMYWDSHTKVIPSIANRIIRGAGNVVFYTKGDPTPAEKTTYEQIGRTTKQGTDNYTCLNENKVRMDLLETKGNFDAMPFVEKIDNVLFLTTTTQFMVSGIGQNGSRAATSEQKSSYEMSLNYIKDSFDNFMQGFIDTVIEMSPYYNIPDDEWPVFESDPIVKADLSRVATDLKLLVDSGLSLTPDDWNHYRELFGLPKNIIQQQTITPTNDVNPDEVIQQNKLHKKTRSLSNEALEFENKMLNVKEVEDHYEGISLKAKMTIQKYYTKFLNDVKIQLADNKDKNIIVKNSLMFDMINELNTLYQAGVKKGRLDVKNEIAKLDRSNKLTIKLSTDPERLKKQLERNAKKLFMRAKERIEDKLSMVNNQFVKNAGGIANIIDGFVDSGKMDKDILSTTVEAGYIDGRGDQIELFKDDVDLIFISARFDANLCDECEPYDGKTMTLEEFNDNGFKFENPVNPFCLGDSRCRCQALIYSLK